MSPALYSMQGTNDLMATVTKVKQNLNPDLNLLGVIINGYDSIPVITRQIREEITSSFGDYVFNSVLSKSIKIEEAIARKNGLITLTRGKVKDEVITIGEELVQRLDACSERSRGAC
jgi:chromosome partitioning protein